MYNKKKISSYAIYALTLCIVALCVFFIIKVYTKEKTCYVVIQEVYNNFDMKKELEKKFLTVKNARQKIIDSLVLELKYVDNERQGKKNNKQLEFLYNNMKDNLIQKKQQFDEDNTSLTSQYDTQILTQLNQYIKDFGKENKYIYVFGANGSGDVLYADESKNQTKELIIFINDKYSGKADLK
jgi:outer membrane protein